MTRTKNKYDVTTKACSLTDNATDEKGSVSFTTFMSEDFEYSNDYIMPFHAICEVKVKLSQETEEVDDPTCQTGDEPTPPAPGEPRIEGADNATINQGADFDLTEGVTAYDGEGNEIPFTVTPSEVDKCEVGVQTFTYEADGVTKERKITVTQIANPTISGLSELTVEVGEEFDPLDGVSAVDGNGNPATVTVGQPTPPSEYPYVIATFGSFRNDTVGNNAIDTSIIFPAVNQPKHKWERGNAVIENLVVDGNNFGTVTADAETQQVNNRIFLYIAPSVFYPLAVTWYDDGSVDNASVDNETEEYTPTYSWDSITVTMTGRFDD